MRTNLLLATAAATLAFAAPAAAAPFTDVGPFTGPAGQITLGGGNSAAPAQIDWGLAGGVPNPTLSGRLFMDNVPGVQARVRVAELRQRRSTSTCSARRTARSGTGSPAWPSSG